MRRERVDEACDGCVSFVDQREGGKVCVGTRGGRGADAGAWCLSLVGEQNLYYLSPRQGAGQAPGPRIHVPASPLSLRMTERLPPLAENPIRASLCGHPGNHSQVLKGVVTHLT